MFLNKYLTFKNMKEYKDKRVFFLKINHMQSKFYSRRICSIVKINIKYGKKIRSKIGPERKKWRPRKASVLASIAHSTEFNLSKIVLVVI